MRILSAEELCALPLCDAVAENICITQDIVIGFSGAGIEKLVFSGAKAKELRIMGYEVLDENEEVVFDMPDVEILGDKIRDALFNLAETKPHAVGVTMRDNNAVLILSDDTDTYELEIAFEFAGIE